MTTERKTHTGGFDSFHQKGFSSEPVLQLFRKVLSSRVSTDFTGNILELGCGVGNLTQIISELTPHGNLFTGDLEILSHQPGRPRFVQMNANCFHPFRAHTFDLIIASELIEHLENVWLFLRESSRVLKTNGILILSTPNIHSVRSIASWIVRGWHAGFGPLSFPEHISPISNFSMKMALDQAGLMWETNVYSDSGSFPGFPSFRWQTTALGRLLRGAYFSDNVLSIAHKKASS